VFVRPCWMPKSRQDVYDVIRENSWGQLISNGADGPYVTNLPFVLSVASDDSSIDSPGEDRIVLTSHIARGNDHSAAIQAATEPVLAVFEGPSSYVTASWYPGRDMPPTIYYSAVHCYGHLVFQEKPQLLESVEDLTARSERHIPDGWKTSEIPREAVIRRLNSILGFELHVDRLEAKFKLGQDEPKPDAMAVGERLLASNDPRDRALGAMVVRYNEGRSS
jgi:transcriptional regulator